MAIFHYQDLVANLRERGIKNERVIDAILTVPRHEFMTADLQKYATDDTALPIECEQTISQPYVVARMTESILDTIPPPQKVLEIGTGSGYQAAILSKVVKEVYTVERIKQLSEQAQLRFQALGYHNIHCLFADGYQGWLEHAPYDAIIVTAASPEIPENLLKQLSMNGNLIIPVGDRFSQTLLRITRTQEGYREIALDPVIFVPLLPGTR